MATVSAGEVASSICYFYQFEVIIIKSLEKFIVCIMNRRFFIVFDAMFKWCSIVKTTYYTHNNPRLIT